MRAARIDQHDAAVTPAGRAFDKVTERFEYSRHRLAARHHFEQALFTDEQSVNPLPVVDISVQEVPKDDTPFRISQGESAHVEPAVDPVSTAATAFNVGRKAVDDQTKPTLARSQSFLSPPSVLDVDTHSAPFDDLSGCVS